MWGLCILHSLVATSCKSPVQTSAWLCSLLIRWIHEDSLVSVCTLGADLISFNLNRRKSNSISVAVCPVTLRR